jgi:tetratricopeptide (TPR) repeat protein
MESRKPCRVVLGVPVFALTHNAPLPDAATPMVITGQTCEFGVGRILDVHSDALMNRNSLSRVFANSPELIGLLDRKEILARPWLDLIAQLSIWAVTSGLNRDFMLREALAYADDRGLIKLEDQAAAETALIARCVQTFLDAAHVRINFYEPGIRYNPKVEVVSDLKVPEDVYLYKKGVNLYEQGRFNESEKAFSKIVSDLSASLNFYDSFRVKEWILRCRFRQGKGPGVDPGLISPEEIKKMLALSPVSVREYARLMSMNLKEHAFNSDTAVLMGERWPEFYFYFAEYLMKNKKYTPALENFYRFLKVYEKRDDLHRLRIIRYDDEEDFKDTYTQNSYIKDMAGEYRFLSARAKTWIMLISAALTGAEK